MSEETKRSLDVLLGPLSCRSALFGIWSVALWGLMAVPMTVLIALADGDADWICWGAIIPNIAGLVLGILGFILGCRGNADRVDRTVPLWVRLIPIASFPGIALNVFLSWPVFAILYFLASEPFSGLAW